MARIEALFQAHYGLIFKFLMSLCHEESLAEELTQETFFRAYINLAQLKDDAKAVSWLCSIARNLYFAEFRRRGRLTSLEDGAYAADGAERTEEKCLAEEVLRCVLKLEEPYREVFLLAVMGEVPLKEISRLFGKSESWARVTFYRAKQKVQERMAWNEL